WADCELTEQASDEFRVTPDAKRPGYDWEQVPLLAPELSPVYKAWREATVSDERAKLPTANANGKASAKAQTITQSGRVEEPYTKDFIDCLQVDTRFLHELGWSQPPGTRKVFYWRPLDALSSSPARVRSLTEMVPSVEFVLLALAAESNNRGNLPATTRTLP